MQHPDRSPFNLAVLAAGLGFFIDAFDLFLFNVYRVPSLKELGYEGRELTRSGEWLLSVQMAGMMLGGILSGVWADRFGRVRILFGSILLYSLANIANGFIEDLNTYALIRFLAGVGLAGELGAGITLVGERMSPEKRGYGTIMVATLGALGAVSAGIAGTWLPWRTAFIVAGFAGLGMLFLRMKSMESPLYRQQQSSDRGSIRLLFSNRTRVIKYVACILMGVPIWYSVGLLITMSPELAEINGISGLKMAYCFILFQVGIAMGDLSSGLLSQWLKTRKKVIMAFMFWAVLASIFHFYLMQKQKLFYVSCFLIGLGCGYLSVFVTATSEHFGTNLRVTVTSTVTNFMRGAVTLLIPFHQWIEWKFGLQLTGGLIVTGVLVWMMAFVSTMWLPETYGKSMDFVET